MVEEPDEQKERSQNLLEHPQIQQLIVSTLTFELQTRDDASKMNEVVGFYKQLMVPNDARVDSITRRFRKLSLLYHPDQRGAQ